MEARRRSGGQDDSQQSNWDKGKKTWNFRSTVLEMYKDSIQAAVKANQASVPEGTVFNNIQVATQTRKAITLTISELSDEQKQKVEETMDKWNAEGPPKEIQRK